MDSNFFALISRMRYIERWSLMRNSIHENIQEHSHMVAVIAHALGVIRRDVYGIDCDPEACAAVALYHDASEILTGDLPTPIKYHDDEIMSAYRRVETIASEKLLGMLPEELQAAFEPILTGQTQRELQAERLHQMHRRAQGRQQRISKRRKADSGGNTRLQHAGGRIFHRAFHSCI